MTFGFCVLLNKSINQAIATTLCYFPVTFGFCVLLNKSINQSIDRKLTQIQITSRKGHMLLGNLQAVTVSWEEPLGDETVALFPHFTVPMNVPQIGEDPSVLWDMIAGQFGVFRGPMRHTHWADACYPLHLAQHRLRVWHAPEQNVSIQLITQSKFDICSLEHCLTKRPSPSYFASLYDGSRSRPTTWSISAWTFSWIWPLDAV